MKMTSILALVVSSSSPLQDGLLAVMTTIQQVNAVLVAEDVNSAMRIVQNHRPALIIMDMSSLQLKEFIKQVKAQWPQIRLIVHAEDTNQQKEAANSGADSVLMKGFSAKKLIAIVEELVEQRESLYPADK